MSLQTSPVSDPIETKVPQGWALVIDDHPLFCDALELTLRSVANFSRVVTADSLERARERLADDVAPALILLDLNLPDVDDLDRQLDHRPLHRRRRAVR